MTDTEYDTTMVRAILAVLAGSAMGAALVVLFTAVASAISDGTPAALVPAQIFKMAVILLPLVFIAFAASALFIAGPCWSVLHLMGRRTWLDAVVLGALAAFALCLLLPGMAHMPTLLVAATVAAGTGWRVAYKRRSTQ